MPPDANTVDAYLDWYFNATQQATFFEVSLDVSPWSPEGTAWLLQGRQALRMLEAQIPDVIIEIVIKHRECIPFSVSVQFRMSVHTVCVGCVAITFVGRVWIARSMRCLVCHSVVFCGTPDVYVPVWIVGERTREHMTFNLLRLSQD